MKKSILTLTCFFFLVFVAHAQIVITEIMFNPPPSGADTLEYIELYNNSGSAVDVSNWHFTRRSYLLFPLRHFHGGPFLRRYYRKRCLFLCPFSGRYHLFVGRRPDQYRGGH
ncbi:MAG: lamin tail domain-containing protein [Lewinellaceae bacterium]|nr:lamin tail domain-containing protein [Lewinellaceae bacterium]